MILQIVHAFSVKTWGRLAWWLLSGLVYAAAGIIAFANPLLASSVLTLLLLRCSPPVMRIWVGLENRERQLGDRRGRRGDEACRPGHSLAGRSTACSSSARSSRSTWIFQGAALTAFGMALKLLETVQKGADFLDQAG